MKKILKMICMITSLALIAAALCSPTGAVQIKRYYGDIDNDGYVTTYDARLILFAAIEVSPLEGYDAVAADIDCDGDIALNDVRLALMTAANIREKELIGDLEFDACPEQFIRELNLERVREGAASIRYSKLLSAAAQQSAKEFAEQTGTAIRQPDGTYYYDLIERLDFDFNSADKIIFAGDENYKNALDGMLEERQSAKALCNSAFTTAGVGGWSPDGRTFYWCVLLIEE